MDVREITADEARPLRVEVLRDGDVTADVAYPEDSVPGAFHLGAFEHGALIGIASFSPSDSPHRASARAWQLRGMAVTPAHQGRGVGAVLIAAARERIGTDDAKVLWCNARDTAAAFYARLGFVTVGDGFTTKSTGLPHHVMVLDL